MGEGVGETGREGERRRDVRVKGERGERVEGVGREGREGSLLVLTYTLDMKSWIKPWHAAKQNVIFTGVCEWWVFVCPRL